MQKLWLTLITQNREQDIEELTRDTYDYFDGIVAVVNQPSDDRTFDILDARKKEGRIIKRPFVRHHAHLMNEFLLAGVIKNLDWFLIVDSPERINLKWLSRLRKDIEAYESEGIGGLFLDRIYLARYTDAMEFVGGVHWGLRPFLGNVVTPSRDKDYVKSDYIINTRKTLNSAYLNPAKYYFCYGSDSHLELLYRHFGDEVYNRHCNLRFQFRLYCEQQLGLEFTLDSLIDYLKNNVGKYSDFFEQVIEIETNIKDLFRLYVLNQPLEDLSKNRFDWSYFIWKNEGLIDQNPEQTKFMGRYNNYNLSIGRKRE